MQGEIKTMSKLSFFSISLIVSRYFGGIAGRPNAANDYPRRRLSVQRRRRLR
jgi:hypothetical protein